MIETPCIIRRVGVATNGRTLLDLKAANGTFGWNWFLASASMSREMLAIALAASTSEKQVNCMFDDPSVAYAEVLAMQIIN
jgi:hypothetical protein